MQGCFAAELAVALLRVFMENEATHRRKRASTALAATLTVAAAVVFGSCSQRLPERTFKSEDEGFAVDFPGKPEIRAGQDQHWAVKAFQVGERVGEGGILYSVNFSRLAAGGKLVGQGIEALAILTGQVRGFCSTLGTKPENVTLSEAKFENRYPALEYSCPGSLAGRSVINEGWMILQPDRVVRISVSYGEELREAVFPRSRMFLFSLALR